MYADGGHELELTPNELWGGGGGGGGGGGRGGTDGSSLGRTSAVDAFGQRLLKNGTSMPVASLFHCMYILYSDSGGEECTREFVECEPRGVEVRAARC